MTKTFMPKVATLDELRDLQLKGLQKTVKHAYEGSPVYRKNLDEAGVGPEGIRSLDDLEKLPFTTSKDLQEGYPFPLLSVPFEKVVRIHASSGTTGKRKSLLGTVSGPRASVSSWGARSSGPWPFRPVPEIWICNVSF